MLIIGAVLAYTYIPQSPQKDTSSSPITKVEDTEATQPKATTRESYSGERVSVANQFSIKVPNGWHASISEANGFRAIMFARPEQLSSLRYQAEEPTTISRDGIASWSGLTEHFFVLAADTSQRFNPTDHQEITLEQITFDDGTVGKKYYVVKHAEEAKKWNGLLRDNEWQGRTYIYEKDGKQIEAHLALYPSSHVDIAFFESVVRSISTVIGQ